MNINVVNYILALNDDPDPLHQCRIFLDVVQQLPGRIDGIRMAGILEHEAQLASGSSFFRRSATGFGGFAKVPPLTGSITMIGLPCFLATS